MWSKLTRHKRTRVLRRRKDTGSQTRTSSRTTRYELAPPAVPGPPAPPGRIHHPRPGVLHFPGLLTGTPHLRACSSANGRGVTGLHAGQHNDPRSSLIATGIPKGPGRVCLGSRGRHCIRHLAWAAIPHHTPGYSPILGTCIPIGTVPIGLACPSKGRGY